MRYTKKLLILSLSVVLLALLGGYLWLKYAAPYELPTEKLQFSRLKPPSSNTVYDGSNKAIFYTNFNEPIRFYRPLHHFDPKLKQWVVLLEDAKFYQHKGFDETEIKNSFIKNIKEGKIKRGASTITQQLAKNVFLDQKRSWMRKFFEVPWAMKLETDLSKQQILELYLNYIEWGPNIAGAEAAARYYFGKSASTLSYGEAMYLALVIPSPLRFDLLKNKSSLEAMNKKKAWLIKRLINEKKIDPALEEPLLRMSFGVKAFDDPARQFPAPKRPTFNAPQWVNLLTEYITKDKDIHISLQSKIQALGDESESWTDLENLPNTLEASKTWCAKSFSSTVGYWELDDLLVPTNPFTEQIEAAGFMLIPCKIDRETLVF